MSRLLAFIVVATIAVGAVLYLLRGMARAAGIFGTGARSRCAGCGKDVERTVRAESKGELCEDCWRNWAC